MLPISRWEPAAALTAQSASFYLYNATAILSQAPSGSTLTLQGVGTAPGLPINTNGLNFLSVHGNQVSLTTDLSLTAADIGLSGAYVVLTGDSGITSSGSISAANLGLIGDATITGNVSSRADLSFTNLTAATVSANTLSAYPYIGTTTFTLTAGSISAPGGFQQFNGFDGGFNGTVAFAPTDGLGLNLTSTSLPVTFGTSGSPSAPAIGASTLNGGNAAAASSLPGGNGGFLHVISDPGISVDAALSATTGMNGNSVTTGGAGGTVILQSAGAIEVSSSIDVSSNDVPNHRVSASGGNITVASTATQRHGDQCNQHWRPPLLAECRRAGTWRNGADNLHGREHHL